MKKKLIVLLMITTMASVFAEAIESGNGSHGGKGVYCKNNGVPTVEVLDYFELSQNGNQLNLPGKTYQEKVQNVIKRLSQIDKGMANFLEEAFSRFDSEKQLLDRASIIEIDDTRELIKGKKDCYKVQVAVQREDPRPLEKRYLIDIDYWKLMDQNQKAGLVLHELILSGEMSEYSYFKVSDWREQFYHRNWIDEETLNVETFTTDNLRYYNGVISSEEFSNLSLVDYIEALQKSLLNHDPTIEIGGRTWHIQHLEVDSNLNVVAGRTLTPFSLNLAGGSIVCSTGISKYHSNGILKSCTLESQATLNISGHQVLVGYLEYHKIYRYDARAIEFHSNGSVSSAYIIPSSVSDQAKADWKCYTYDNRNLLKFYFDENGKFLKCD